MSWEKDYARSGDTGYRLFAVPLTKNASAIVLNQRRATAGDFGGRTIDESRICVVTGATLDPVLCVMNEFGEGGYTDSNMSEYEWDARHAHFSVLDDSAAGLKNISVTAYDSHIEKEYSDESERLELVADDMLGTESEIFVWDGNAYQPLREGIDVPFYPDPYQDTIMFYTRGEAR